MVTDSLPSSPYGIICPIHGKQGLSFQEYDRQMSRPDSLWKCACGATAIWDDDRYEAAIASAEAHGAKWEE